MSKSDLIKFMHSCGFDWICDIAYADGTEMVASKMLDSDELWWRPIHVEGSGFYKLFSGSIKHVMDHERWLDDHPEILEVVKKGLRQEPKHRQKSFSDSIKSACHDDSKENLPSLE